MKQDSCTLHTKLPNLLTKPSTCNPSPNIYTVHTYPIGKATTGWRRLIGSPKLQIISHKRATKYRSLLQKMTYKDKGSYESSPPCTVKKDKLHPTHWKTENKPTPQRVYLRRGITSSLSIYTLHTYPLGTATTVKQEKLRLTYWTPPNMYTLPQYYTLHTYPIGKATTGWRRLIESPKLQIISYKRATKYRSLLQKMTYKDKGS